MILNCDKCKGSTAGCTCTNNYYWQVGPVIQQGWECPRCGTIWGPQMPCCSCKKEATWTQGTWTTSNFCETKKKKK